MHGRVLSTVATDVLALQYQTILTQLLIEYSLYWAHFIEKFSIMKWVQYNEYVFFNVIAFLILFLEQY